jgi:cephalosporin hydroxylase
MKKFRCPHVKHSHIITSLVSILGIVTICYIFRQLIVTQNLSELDISPDIVTPKKQMLLHKGKHFFPEQLNIDCSPNELQHPLSSIVLEPMFSTGEMKISKGTNRWGIPMANSTLTFEDLSGTPQTLSFDQILYGYDLIFENLAIFTHTKWFGVGIQQNPTDAFALQQTIWDLKPDLLIEIGTNTGGSAIFYASIMREYNDDAMVMTIDPKDPGKDWAESVNRSCSRCLDVRCTSIWNSKHVKFIQGLSTDEKVLEQVSRVAKNKKVVMVMQDGSHQYEDVLNDLRLYDKYVTPGSYMIVQDTKMTRIYESTTTNGYALRAVEKFLLTQGKSRYVIDKQFEHGLYSQHHHGWLKKL